MKKVFFLSLALAIHIMAIAQGENRNIDLSGIWRFQLDPMGFGKTAGSELYLSKLTETITLPGTLDEGGKGITNQVAHVDRLSRKFEYCGQAWFQREVSVPADWSGKEITLNLERCHWETAVYVDGKAVGVDERLSTPNRFNLTKELTPGMHTITICVDNRLKYPMDQWNHGTTEYTQTNWNGIVGDISIVAKNANNINQVDVYPNIDEKKIVAKISLNNKIEDAKGKLLITINEKNGKEVNKIEIPVEFTAENLNIEKEISLGKNIKLWDEFSPNLYTLKTTLITSEGKESEEHTFGMRKVEQGKNHIKLNNRNIHLRGALDCCVFPITGYPSTNVDDWKKIFKTVKSYGMNHIRFHSWCPPKAAFEAADEVGIYLQAELPMWIKDVGRHEGRLKFFEKEMYALLNEYGNHPSFILYCNGNENEGDFTVLEDLIQKGQAHDNRRLYSASTARKHVESDQYYTSHVTSKGGITVYEGVPWTNWDKNKESDIDVPVIAHESGQRCMYPNFNEIKKYKGILEARNFKIFQERLAKNNMLHQADDFFQATGAHTVLQYKEVNESLLRSSKSGGFQLLGLADFPGQGSAFVGILDAFWESKGLVTPEKFRESCDAVVLLARINKRAFTDKEKFEPQIGLYNFGPTDIAKGNINWSLVDENGKIIKNGKISHPSIKLSTVSDSLGVISIALNNLSRKYTLKVDINNSKIKNEWDIWVYPTDNTTDLNKKNIVKSWEEAKPLLSKGENVLLIPEKVDGRKTHFASHFWNPIMFNWNPMIVGTLINEKHAAFKDFSTSNYADWQWWDILNNCTSIDLTDLVELTPVIQSIDTYEVNRKLGIAFEAKVGNGNLFVLSLDATKKIDERPATKQLIYSINKYINSGEFKPTLQIKEYELDKVFATKEKVEQTNKSNAAILQLLNQ